MELNGNNERDCRENEAAMDACIDMRILAAAQEYLNRQSRLNHPAGKTDGGGRWFPSDPEWQMCCKGVRAPSRAWPWSLMTHCRTMAHVAHLYGVEEAEVRAVVKAIKAAQDCASCRNGVVK